MAQPKHRKSKGKKPNVKKHGKKVDLTQIHSQLDALGLKIIQVTADGNCLFRAVADQLEGNEDEHKKYRKMVVQYILNHREGFEPFIEDDVPFEEYCLSMEKDGTWAGHTELQAASLVTRRNICIHQAMFPRWYIRNFTGHAMAMIHLSYHDGEHYNSVRLKEDSCQGPARPITIKVDADISATDHKKKVAVDISRGSSCADTVSIKLVMAGTGCENADRVEQVLQAVDGDVDVAIEYLIAEEETYTNVDEALSESMDNYQPSGDQIGNCDQSKVVAEDITRGKIHRNKDDQSVGCFEEDKEIVRKEECGSTKKCKGGKSSEAPAINDCSARKSKKESKRGRKKDATREVAKDRSGSLPDVGSLCI